GVGCCGGCLLSSHTSSQCQVATPHCHIQKCNTDFVSLTYHLSPAVDGINTEFCKALRSYSACTQKTAKSCRGDLIFHAAMLGISDLMSQRNCSRDGPTSSTRPEDSFQTCKVQGAWPLIDNDYLTVQVTNVPVVPGSSATATNKITIIFKPYEGCTDQRVYQAVTDNLPAAFDDGTVSSGEPIHMSVGTKGATGKVRALWISERSPGHHVELHAGYIGVTVIVRQLGRYLTMAVRIPEELAQAYDSTQDLQLCLNGCPGGERIDKRGTSPCPSPLRRSACSSSSYADPATPHRHKHPPTVPRSAQKDMESLHPHQDKWRIYPRGSAHSTLHSDSQHIKQLAVLLLYFLSVAM
ncbi:RGM domain family member B, partial [Dissostichus eleginoides]